MNELTVENILNFEQIARELIERGSYDSSTVIMCVFIGIVFFLLIIASLKYGSSNLEKSIGSAFAIFAAVFFISLIKNDTHRYYEEVKKQDFSTLLEVYKDKEATDILKEIGLAKLETSTLTESCQYKLFCQKDIVLKNFKVEIAIKLDLLKQKVAQMIESEGVDYYGQIGGTFFITKQIKFLKILREIENKLLTEEQKQKIMKEINDMVEKEAKSIHFAVQQKRFLETCKIYTIDEAFSKHLKSYLKNEERAIEGMENKIRCLPEPYFLKN